MLIDRLRAATSDAHRRLEAELALLEPPLNRERFAEVLGRFHGFHAVWEPLMRRLLGDAFSDRRARLHLLEQDLADLGATGRPHPRDLPIRTAAEAWGSLYVLEGSTLGGKVIAKALEDAAWRPERGLRYFDPYGRSTAREWRSFLERLALTGEDEDGVIRGAVATFEHLIAWLRPRELTA